MFLCNEPRLATAEGQDGFCMMHYNAVTRPSPRVVVQKGMSKNNKHKVALISGGGAGHEPFAAGFVGRGMLTATVAGDLYASPPTNAIESAMNACFNSGYESVLLMVLNYTGDRLTFGLAQSRSSKTGLYIIADDCTTKHLRIGARGLSGAVFLCKIAGAMIENGATVTAVKDQLESMNSRLQTIGVCLRACCLPGKVGPILEIEHGYAELGLGIHGEAGVEKVKVTSCDALVAKMIAKLMEGLKSNSGNPNMQRIAFLVNNLGGMSHAEMSLIARSVLHCLHNQFSVQPTRLYVGTYMTSLDAKGFSFSIFLANNDIELDYLDAETEAPVWAPSCTLPPFDQLDFKFLEQSGQPNETVWKMPQINKNVASIMRRVCSRLISMTDRLNFLDSGGLGDGDTGSTLAQMYRRILSDVEKSEPDQSSETSLNMIANILFYLSKVAETEMGGTSGGLYATGLQSAGDTLKAYAEGRKKADNVVAIWSEAVSSALRAVQFLGGAQPGDRSLVDPLAAILNCLANGALLESANVGEKAAESTAEMKAHVGRAAAAREVGNAGDEKRPDPGATALASMWSELVAASQ